MTALSRWSPFVELGHLWPRDFFDRSIVAGIGSETGLVTVWRPRCDVSESDTEIIVHAELPGVEAKDMDVSVSDHTPTVRGEKRGESQETKDGGSYSERFFGSFERSLTMPDNVDEANISAALKDGVLEVRVPRLKAAEVPSRKIEISS